MILPTYYPLFSESLLRTLFIVSMCTSSSTYALSFPSTSVPALCIFPSFQISTDYAWIYTYSYSDITVNIPSQY